MYCSIYQAVEIYDDIRSTFEDKASHGDKAEIFTYRLLPNNHQMLLGGSSYRKDPVNLERYNNTKIFIDEINPKQWVKNMVIHFTIE